MGQGASGSDCQDPHAGCQASLHPGLGILDDKAPLGRNSQKVSRQKKNLRMGFGFFDLGAVGHSLESLRQPNGAKNRKGILAGGADRGPNASIAKVL